MSDRLLVAVTYHPQDPQNEFGQSIYDYLDCGSRGSAQGMLSSYLNKIPQYMEAYYSTKENWYKKTPLSQKSRTNFARAWRSRLLNDRKEAPSIPILSLYISDQADSLYGIWLKAPRIHGIAGWFHIVICENAGLKDIENARREAGNEFFPVYSFFLENRDRRHEHSLMHFLIKGIEGSLKRNFTSLFDQVAIYLVKVLKEAFTKDSFYGTCSDYYLFHLGESVKNLLIQPRSKDIFSYENVMCDAKGFREYAELFDPLLKFNVHYFKKLSFQLVACYKNRRFLGQCEQNPLGWLAYFRPANPHKWSDRTKILSLYVQKEYRRLGIATDLIKFSLPGGLQHGSIELHLPENLSYQESEVPGLSNSQLACKVFSSQAKLLDSANLTTSTKLARFYNPRVGKVGMAESVYFSVSYTNAKQKSLSTP